MNDSIPSLAELQQVRSAITIAWREVLPPDWEDFVINDVDSQDVRTYFWKRPAALVDLDDPSIAQETPLLYLKDTAVIYYLPCYLEYCLAIDSRIDDSDPLMDFDFPEIHVIMYLCSGMRDDLHKIFTLNQIQSIIIFLKMVSKYHKFYGFDGNVQRDSGRSLEMAPKWPNVVFPVLEEDVGYLIRGVTRWMEFARSKVSNDKEKRDKS